MGFSSYFMWCFVILLAAIVYLTTRLLMRKKEIRRISEQLDSICADLTREKIVLSLTDRDLSALAAKLNRAISLQQEQQVSMRKQELRLKETMSNLSHDIRTPLTCMNGYLQLINKGQLPQEDQKYFSIIESKAAQMSAMVEQLFEFSLLESDGQKPDFESVNVTNLLLDVIAGYVPQMETASILPDIQIPDGPVYVIADPNMLLRVVTNLLENALRHGGKMLCISLDVDCAACHIIFSNSIPPSCALDAGRLFDRLYTCSPPKSQSRCSGTVQGQYGSTGLGLPIVKLLMEKMNGKAEAAIMEGMLRITCSIPVYQNKRNKTG